jgi:tRNA A-37 threonylcarbamoyl transferase component Bud32
MPESLTLAETLGSGPSDEPAAPPHPGARPTPAQETDIVNAQPTARAFGDYDLIRELARGAMGVVYLARHRSADREVALKMVLQGEHASAEAKRRFLEEARAAAKLDHPNIVQVYDVGVCDGQHYFTMPYIDGPTLAGLVQQAGPLEEARAAKILKGVAEAVQYAHECGFVHRDIKPSNILLDNRKGGMPRLADFGLAKSVNDARDLTLLGQVLGTVPYMAPEQAKGDNTNVGPPADVYALGSNLYFTLTAKLPFDSKSLMELLHQVVYDPPRPPHEYRPTLDRGLEAICLKCMEKDPANRYPSAGAVAEALEQWLRTKEVRPAAAAPARPPRRRLPAAVAAAALVFLAVAAYKWVNRPETRIGLAPLTSTFNSARQTVTLTTEVTSGQGNSPVGGGTVSFAVDDRERGTATVDSQGIATAEVDLGSNFPAGAHTISARYVPGSFFVKGSDSGSSSLTIKPADTAVKIAQDASDSEGRTLRVRAGVTTTSGAMVSEGSVTFTVEKPGGKLEPVAVKVVNGEAVATLPLPAGTYKVKASYVDRPNDQGGSNYVASTAHGTLTVRKPSDGVVLTSTESAPNRKQEDADARKGREANSPVSPRTLPGAEKPRLDPDAEERIRVTDEIFPRERTLSQFRFDLRMLDVQQGPGGYLQPLAGKPLRFEITVDKDAYVTILDRDAYGHVVRIFPNRHEGDNLVLAGRPRVIPGSKRYTFDPELTRQPERVYALASTGDWDPGEGDSLDGFTVYRQLEQLRQVVTKVRGIKVKAKAQLADLQLADQVIHYTVVPPGK